MDFNAPVPIVGQKFALRSGFPTVLVVCNCEAQSPLLLIARQPQQCPACLTGFVVNTAAFDLSTGQMNANIHSFLPRPAEGSPLGI